MSDKALDSFAAPWWLKLLLASGSLVLTLLLMELCIRLFAPQNLTFFDWTRIKRPSHLWEGYEYIPGAYTPNYNGVPVSINSLGLRDHEFAIPKPSCVVRLLSLGDSVVFGFGVPNEDVYPKVLESELNRSATGGVRYEVVNAGVEGTGLDYYYRFLLLRAPRLQPDLILLGVTINDITTYPEVEASASEPPASLQNSDDWLRPVSGWLVTHSQLYLWSYMSLKSLLYKLGVLDINKVHYYDFFPLMPPSKEQSRAWNSTLRMLDKIVALARERRYPLVVIVWPMDVQLSRHNLELYRTQLGVSVGDQALSGEPQRRIAEFCRANGVPMVDPMPAFRQADHGQLFLRNSAITFDPVHPSIAGHHLLEQVIFRALNQIGLPQPPASCSKTAPAAGAPR